MDPQAVDIEIAGLVGKPLEFGETVVRCPENLLDPARH
jgi:hypothetical protein